MSAQASCHTLAAALLAALFLPACVPRPPNVPVVYGSARSTVTAIAVQPDGGVLIGAGRSRLDSSGGIEGPVIILEKSRRFGNGSYLARINSLGVMDGAFAPLLPDDSEIHAIAVLANEKILIGGKGLGSQPLRRLDRNGVADDTFHAPDLAMGVGVVDRIVVQADGKILIRHGEAAAGSLSRLNADGAIDEDFSFTCDGSVKCIALQDDGKILVGGAFTTVHSQPRANLARLETNGTLDLDFNAIIVGGEVRTVFTEPGGGIVFSGNYVTVGGIAGKGFARVDASGGLLAFTCPVNGASEDVAMASMVDGSFVLAGSLSYSNPNNPLANRHVLIIAATGEGADVVSSQTYSPQSAALALTADGGIGLGLFSIYKVVVINDILGRSNFTVSYQHSGYTEYAIPFPGTDALEIADGSTVRWLRSGRVPEVSQVTFEHSTDLENWTPLGVANRMIGGWELTGLNLPPAGWLRARGRCVSGVAGGSSGLLQKMQRFPADSVAPDTTIASGPLGVVPDSTAAFVFSSTEPALSYTYKLNSDTPMVVSGPSVTLSGLRKGRHTLTVFATDLAFNQDLSPATRTWFVDDAAPQRDGIVDATFVNQAGLPPRVDGIVTLIAAQPDGRVLIAGGFSTVDGEPRPRIARLRADGALDSVADFGTGSGPTATPGWQYNPIVTAVVVQPDAKILVAGYFNLWNGQPRPGLVRLLANGTEDPAFRAAFGTSPITVIDNLLLQPDGRILASGLLETADGQQPLARLHPGGAQDDSFVPEIHRDESAGIVDDMALQQDGNILVRGLFPTGGDPTVVPLLRLEPNGRRDPTFVIPSQEMVPGYGPLAVQADGRILVATGVAAGLPPMHRLHSDGRPDDTFQLSIEGEVLDIAVQTDGRILLAGGFYGEVDGNADWEGGLVRLLPDGGIESTSTFYQGAGTMSEFGSVTPVSAVELQADGKILIGGGFESVEGQAAQGIARLRNGLAVSDVFTRGNFAAEWHTGGTLPEVRHVRFQWNSGAGWEDMGAASRTAYGWRLDGLSMPLDGRIRAVGRTDTGSGHGSLIATRELELDSPLDMWRERTFGRPGPGRDLSPEIAGNLADPDSDGLSNIFEYALGSDPLQNGPEIQVFGSLTSTGLVITYRRAAGATDVTLGLEQSADLQTWTPVVHTERIVADDGEYKTVEATITVNPNIPLPGNTFLRAKATTTAPP